MLKRKGQRAQPLDAFLEPLFETLKARETDALSLDKVVRPHAISFLIFTFLSKQPFNNKYITQLFICFLF